MRLPSRAECEAFIQDYQTPEHVVQHCIMVNRVANTMADLLIATGVHVHRDLVDRAALLHDLLRVVNFVDFDQKRFVEMITPEKRARWQSQCEQFQGLHHAEAAARELTRLGYPELGATVGAHRADAIHDRHALIDTIEKKILFYADKRVAHTHVVSIDERFAEWGMRHAWDAQKLQEVEQEKQLVLQLERELFAHLSLTPDELKRLQ